MNRDQALAIQAAMIDAIRSLSSAIPIVDALGDAALVADLRRAIGDAMAGIDRTILTRIYASYPDLDDLK